ncbi:Gp49 family protein [Gallibacterium salpingitidis]|uniref:Gp49 family protein n=1 Tax=Gallibacterium salpingitidis TaxID=505341 RepID=UPI00266FC741|nr:Gp49 family protein [Gallibacterium salpingitidis]WKS98779.1 Gp49 family protein [Gallibacterium salpingitidis]
MKKITKEYIESQISNVEFKRGIGTITHCYITVKSGFVVLGESACADEAQFNQSIGESYAYENAFDKLWVLFGFELKRKIGGDYKYRLERESDELKERVDKLTEFLAKDKPEFIDGAEWFDLNEQLVLMKRYLVLLDRRLKKFTNQSH